MPLQQARGKSIAQVSAEARGASLDAAADELLALMPEPERATKPLPRIAHARHEKASTKLAPGALDKAAAELEQLFPVREPTMGEKASIAAGRGVASLAKAPELAGKAAEALGVPRGTIERHLPFIKALADQGRALEQAADVAEDPRFAAQDFGSELARGAGSMLPLAAAGGLGGLAGKVAGRAAVALAGAAQGAVPLYEDVLAQTGDESKAWQGALLGAGLGLTEAMGAGKILAKLNRAGAGGLIRAFERAALETGEEAAHELVQTIGESVGSKVLTDQEISVLDEIIQGGRAGAIGAILGAGLSAGQGALAEGAGRAARPRGRQGVPAAPLAPEPVRAPQEGALSEVTLSGLRTEQPALAEEQGGAVVPPAPPETAAAPADSRGAVTEAERGPATESSAGAGSTPASASPDDVAARILAREPVELAELTPDAIRRAVELRSQQTPGADGPSRSAEGAAQALPEAKTPVSETATTGSTSGAPTDEDVQEDIRKITRRITRELASQIDPQLRREAERDPKTDLLNDRGDKLWSERVIRASRKRADTKTIRVVVDLADLTSLNNLFGHEFADEVIGEYVSKWGSMTREGNAQAARTGGDEFSATLLLGKNDDPQAIIERVESAAAQALQKFGLEKGVVGRTFGADAGWAEVRSDIGDPIAALKEASERADAMSKERKTKRAPGKRKLSAAEYADLAPKAVKERSERLADQARTELEQRAAQVPGGAFGAEPGEQVERRADHLRGATEKEKNAASEGRAEIQAALDDYDYGSSTARDLADALEDLDLPQGVQEALDRFRADVEEDAREHGERGGLEEDASDALVAAVRDALAPKPARAAPPENGRELGLRVGDSRKLVPVDSPERASELYSQMRDKSALGASQFPTATVVDFATGEVLARISYNGRLWGPDGKTPFEAAEKPAKPVPALAPPATGTYTYEKGTGALWIIRGPDGQAVHSVTSKAYAIERTAELNAERSAKADPAPEPAKPTPPTPAQAGGVGHPIHQAMAERKRSDEERERELEPLQRIASARSWDEYTKEKRNVRVGRWDGNMAKDEASPYLSDGRALIKKAALVGPKGMDGLPKSANALSMPHARGNFAEDAMFVKAWNEADKGIAPATIDGVVERPQAVKGMRQAPPLVVAHRADGKAGKADALRLRYIMDVTGADGVSLGESDKAAWVITRGGKKVALLMPITTDGVDLDVEILTLPPGERAAAIDRKRAEIIGEDIDGLANAELLAFPGSVMPDVKRAFAALMKRWGYIREQQATVAGQIPTENFTEHLIRKAQDSFRGIKRAEKAIEGATGEQVDEGLSVYLAEELRRGKAKARLESWDAKHQRPLRVTLRKGGVSPEEFGEALMARHAPERNAAILARDPDNDAGSGMTDAEAAAIMARVQGGKRAGVFQRAFGLFDAMQADIRAGWVRDGLKTQAEVDALEKAFTAYAPLRSDLDEEGGDRPTKGTGRGVNVRGGEYRSATGRHTQADPRSVLAYAFTQAQTAIIRGEKNRVFRTLYDLIGAYPDIWARVVKVNPAQTKAAVVNGLVRQVFDAQFRLGDNVVSGKVDGAQVWLEFDEAYHDIASALNNLGAENAGKLISWAGKATRFLAAVNTRYNPVFPLFNAIRDAAGAFINSQEHGLAFAARTVKDVPKALYALTKQKLGKSGGAKWDAYAKEYQESGAPVSFLDLKSFEDQLAVIEKNARAQSAQGAIGSTLRGWRALLSVIDSANDIVENATRFSAYVHAREDLGMTPARAASWAKNLTTNFERKGDNGATINALYMFANAGIQSTARVGQAVRHPAVRRLLAAGFVGAMAWDQIMRAIGGEDDDGEDRWDKIPAYLKRHNLIFMRPDGTYITIPAPFVYDLFQTMAQQVSGMASGDVKPGPALAEILSASVEAFDPIGSGQTDLGDPASIARTVSPTLLDPLVELATNRDWKGSLIAPTDYGGNKPDAERFWPDASSAAKAATGWLNRASGGDEFASGALDVSPETLDHWASFVTGGLGRTIAQLWDVRSKFEAGESLAPRDIPFVSRLVREPSPFASTTDFHALQDALRAERERAKSSKKLLPGDLGALLRESNSLEQIRQRRRKDAEKLSGDARRVADRETDKLLQTFNRRARKALLQEAK